MIFPFDSFLHIVVLLVLLVDNLQRLFQFGISCFFVVESFQLHLNLLLDTEEFVKVCAVLGIGGSVLHGFEGALLPLLEFLVLAVELLSLIEDDIGGFVVFAFGPDFFASLFLLQSYDFISESVQVSLQSLALRDEVRDYFFELFWLFDAALSQLLPDLQLLRFELDLSLHYIL